MLLGDLIRDGEYVDVSDSSVFSVKVEGVTSCSKNVHPGYVFVSVRGTRTDGVLYAKDSEERGAVLIVCENVPPLCPLPYVKVQNARRTLSFMLHRFWGETADKMRVFAATGTNGKTSTTTFLREILISSGASVGYVGSIDCFVNRDIMRLDAADHYKMATMTTPDPEQFYRLLYEMYNHGARYLVMEASSHALRLDKLAPIRVDAGLFTNFSPEHLDFHLDMSDYLLSKCKLFSLSDRVYLNVDDNVCRSTLGVFGTPEFTYGIETDGVDFRAVDLKSFGISGMSYRIISEKYNFNIRCNIPGKFSVYNSLAAAALALGEGIDEKSVSEAISSVKGIDGRLERLELGQTKKDISVIIDYAHTERALENLLITVCSIRESSQRIITLFGCGGDRDREKRAPMGRVASKYSDVVIITEDNSRNEDTDKIIADIIAGIDKTKPYKIIRDRKQAIEYAIKQAITGDIILLVGKGHEQYEIKNGRKLPFSEKQIVYELLGIESMEDVK